MEGGLISVDRWAEGSQVYFLTHLHADHTVGLSSRWKRGPLYCSRITAKLFSPKFPGFDLSLLRVLEIGIWCSIYLVSLSSGLEIRVEVIAIDANHCPGLSSILFPGILLYSSGSNESNASLVHHGGYKTSPGTSILFWIFTFQIKSVTNESNLPQRYSFGPVMYLFRGEFGTMLYTGDFRWEVANKITQMGKAMLLNALKNHKVDTLYIDNTYCNPSYSFPSREVAAEQVVNIINSYPDHDIIIGIDSLGKEDLLLYISNILKLKIWVWPERLQTMHLLGLHNNFTTKTTLTRIRAVPRYSFSIETLQGLNTFRPTIGIMPSGLPWALKKPGCKKKSHDLSSLKTYIDSGNRYTNNIERHHEYIYTVPYSDHACFVEIVEFVKVLCPIDMKGIVSSSSSYIDPCYHLRHIYGNGSLLCKKLSLEEERERIEGKCKSSFGYEEKLKRKRIKQYHSCLHKTRVSLLRRFKQYSL